MRVYDDNDSESYKYDCTEAGESERLEFDSGRCQEKENCSIQITEEGVTMSIEVFLTNFIVY